jgi:hypothetical protein
MFKFTKKKDAEIDRLEGDLVGGSFGTRRGEPAGGSEALVSRAFEEVVPAPDVAAVEAELVAFIAQAAERGALDAGSARYADQWITKKLAGWLERLPEQLRLRTDVAARIVGYRTANLTVANEHLVALEARLAEDLAEMARLADVLRGEPAEEPSDDSVVTVPTEWSAHPADLTTEH